MSGQYGKMFDSVDVESITRPHQSLESYFNLPHFANKPQVALPSNSTEWVMMSGIFYHTGDWY